MFWYNNIPNASAVLWRRDILERAGGAPTDLRVCGDWMAYLNVLDSSDIAFVSTPLNYFRQHTNNVRTRALRSKYVTLERRRVQQTLINRYGRSNLLRNHDKFLPQYVRELIGDSRMPPYNKVPPDIAIELLVWLARIHPKAFASALKTLTWEQVADLARRAGLLGLARKLKNMVEPRSDLK